MTTTHEPELTEDVDLCLADGRTLNPAAKGWARRPLFRANLVGGWPRTKRWDYWCVQAEDVAATVTYADVDYAGLAVVGWIDLKTHEIGGHTALLPLARGVEVPERVAVGHLEHDGRGFDLDLRYEDDGTTHLGAVWTEKDGRKGVLDVVVQQPPGHESLNVVIPWSDTRFQHTSKHQARPATGTLRVGDREVRFGADGNEAWGVFDAGRGRWPYRTRWNWGGGAGVSKEGPTVGVQIGGKWTEGTGFTENGVLVDGRLVKLGDELRWTYDWDQPMRPWRVQSPDGRLDLTLEPVHDRHEKTNALVLRTEVHQVFGHWSGTVPGLGDTETLTLDGALGFAEESRSRW